MNVVTLSTLKAATGSEAVTGFIEETVLPGTDWNLVKVRRSTVRLEPPHTYWVTYRVLLGRGELVYPEPDEEPILDVPIGALGGEEAGAVLPVAEGIEEELPEPHWSEERELRLVGRGVFDTTGWSNYRERLLATSGGRTCDPLGGIGYPVLFDETQHAFWFYPYDPSLLGLIRAADPDDMRRVFNNHRQHILDGPGKIESVEVELARHLPEIATILRYQVRTDPAEAGKTVYGKVQNGNRGAESHRVMAELWKAAAASDGRLVVPKPLGYHADLGMYLQDSVPGAALGSDRTRPEYLPGILYAAEALATIHESGIPTDKELPLDREIQRLERVVDQFALTHPKGYFLLRELLNHIRDRLRKLAPEEVLPTHGDYKYDQVLHDDGRFSLIDFDFFARAETSFDLGKFCAYLVPSMPKGWEQSVASETARTAFIDRYRSLRPKATMQRFPVYEAVNLGGRAMTLMWTQSRGWQKAAESLLVLGMERLNTRVPR